MAGRGHRRRNPRMNQHRGSREISPASRTASAHRGDRLRAGHAGRIRRAPRRALEGTPGRRRGRRGGCARAEARLRRVHAGPRLLLSDRISRAGRGAGDRTQGRTRPDDALRAAEGPRAGSLDRDPARRGRRTRQARPRGTRRGVAPQGDRLVEIGERRPEGSRCNGRGRTAARNQVSRRAGIAAHGRENQRRRAHRGSSRDRAGRRGIRDPGAGGVHLPPQRRGRSGVRLHRRFGPELHDPALQRERPLHAFGRRGEHGHGRELRRLRRGPHAHGAGERHVFAGTARDLPDRVRCAASRRAAGQGRRVGAYVERLGDRGDQGGARAARA